MNWSMPRPPVKGIFHLLSEKDPVDGHGFALCDNRLQLYGITGVPDSILLECYGEAAINVKCKRCLRRAI